MCTPLQWLPMCTEGYVNTLIQSNHGLHDQHMFVIASCYATIVATYAATQGQSLSFLSCGIPRAQCNAHCMPSPPPRRPLGTDVSHLSQSVSVQARSLLKGRNRRRDRERDAHARTHTHARTRTHAHMHTHARKLTHAHTHAHTDAVCPFAPALPKEAGER